MRPIDAEVFEELFGQQIERGATDFFDAVEDALQDAPTLSLNTLRDAIYEDAVAHGLWQENDDPTVCSWLIKGEATELDEAASDWADYGWNKEEPDETFSEELADVIIMSLSVAGKLGIDIDAAVRRKMEINKGRAWKHGKE